ncbi:MAG: DegT/DnrJ/EryC1/StrS family aminotransferase [Deltaproteobacteria bacterium]|nr:DegT/DnrJ/EryC1/StrS family aminotransferase [Deltaproteobacteria bacterium]
MLALKGGPKVRERAWPKWPEHGPEEVAAVTRALESGRWGGFPAPGPEASRFAQTFAQYVGSPHAVLAANGTVTLKVLLRALKVGAGDEVIVPALTWTATAACAVYVNAVPVFADIDPETLCLDPASVESLITPKTKAIIPVHLGSAMADLDALVQLAQRHGLALIEDCAHAHGARWNDRGAGSIGDAGSFSFQSSKLLTAGEGGAITTRHQELKERCQALINCGRKEPGYDQFAGPVLGWNDRITELQAALLSAQLLRLEDQHQRRAANVAHFQKRLAELGPGLGLRFQRRDPRITRQTSYETILLFESAAWKGLSRDRFVDALEAEGVPADGGFYVPIPDRIDEIFPLNAREYPEIRARYGDALRPAQVHCPVAKKVAYEQTVWLHHHLFLGTTADVDDVVAAIAKIREGVDALL